MIKSKKIFRILCTFLCCLVLINTLGVSAAAEGSSVPSATTNVVAGLGYTVSSAPSESYSDSGRELTDGIYGDTDITHAAWQGLNMFTGSPISIVFDLPNAKSISSIKVNFLQSQGSGIFLPNSDINMYVSTDKNSWTLLKNIQPVAKPELSIIESYEWALAQDGINGDISQASVSALYVKVEIKSTLEWIFIDEIEVMGNDVPVVTNPSNVVAGLGYMVSHARHTSYPDTENRELTDGIYSTGIYSDAAWQGFNNADGDSVSVEFNLPQTKSISSIKANFRQEKGSGIYVPLEINMYSSLDNISWTLLKNIKPIEPSDNISKSYEWALDQDGINGDMSITTSAAISVKVDIKLAGEWVFIDEIEVMGNDVSADPEPEPEPNTPKNLASNLSVSSPGAIGYSYSIAPSSDYSDTGNKLTDDINESSAWDGNSVAFYTAGGAVRNYDVTFNIGDFKSISGVNANFLKDIGAGISLAASYEISVSDDGNRWVSLKSNTISDITSDSGASRVGWDGATDKVPGVSPDAAMAYVKYVKVSFTNLSLWCFINDIQILGFDGQAEGAVSLWNEDPNPDPDPDPTTPHNLALGKNYTMSEPPLTYLDSGKELTNGKYGITDYGDSEWVGHSGGGLTRTFTFDLGVDCSISEISTNFLFDGGARILYPGRYDILVSQDGQEWSTLPSDIMFVNPEESPITFKANWLANNNITPNEGMTEAQVYGRYVRIVTGTQGWTFLDEVEIIGETGKTAAAITLLPDSAIVKDYLKSGEKTAGIKNLLLAYNGHYAANLGDWTKDDFMPYVAYLDKEGKPVDTFFDGILLLGIWCPEGRNFGGTNNIEQSAYKNDWEWYLDKNFNGELKQLNEAMIEVSAKLGRTVKEKVVLSLPYPDPIQTDFGDVDGDGISECLNPTVDPVNAIANQKKVVKWYVDKLLAKWNSSDYSNLELGGLYWFEEGVYKGEVEKYASSLVHANNLKMFWIPWFGATGVTQWKKFGFDAVAYQPNHSFDGTPIQRLTDAANKAKEYGMGIEFELDAPAVQGDKDKYRRYIEYLDIGVKEGYMGESGDGAFRAYYQDVKALKTAAESSTPKTRFLYDATYNFTKGTYTSGYLQYLNANNVTYSDLLEINDALTTISKKLENTSITEEEKAYLENEKVKVEALQTSLMLIKANYDSTVAGLAGITAKNVTMDDYTKLSAVSDSIQALLDSKNLSDRWREDLSTYQEAFSVISMVKDTIEKITALPAAKDVTLLNSTQIVAAKTLFSGLNTYQKTFISEELVTKLNSVVSALDSLKPSVPVDTGNIVNPGNTNNTGSKEQKPVVTTTQPEVVGNTATTAVDGKELDKAFANAIASAEGKKVVAIDVKAVDGVNAYTQRLPIAALSAPANNKNIQINTAVASVTLPENMINTKDAKAASTAELSIGTVDSAKLSDAVKQQIGTRPVIELNLKVDGKALAWNNLSAPVTISLDYKPTAEELKNPDHIVVLYIDEAGKVVTVPSGRYDKETGKVTFTTTHFSKYAVAFVNKSFIDMSKHTWAVNPVGVLSSKGIIEGTTDNTFRPGEYITRGDYLLWLVNTLGLTTQFDTNFSDVKATDKYYQALGIAKKLGISAGTGNNKFSPEKQISRQDMMVLTIKALQIAKYSLEIGTSTDVNTYSDFSKIANYAIFDVATMVKSGLITGTGKNKLSPTGTTTRAEASVILYKIYTMK